MIKSLRNIPEHGWLRGSTRLWETLDRTLTRAGGEEDEGKKGKRKERLREYISRNAEVN